MTDEETNGQETTNDGYTTHFFLVVVVPVRKVTTRGEVEAHNAVVWAQESGVHCEIRRATRVRLHVHLFKQY